MKYAIRIDHGEQSYLSDYIERDYKTLQKTITDCCKGEKKVLMFEYKGDRLYFPRDVLKNSVITIISNDNRH